MRRKFIKIVLLVLFGLSVGSHEAAHACSCSNEVLVDVSDSNQAVYYHAESQTNSTNKDVGNTGTDFGQAHCSFSCLGIVVESESKYSQDIACEYSAMESGIYIPSHTSSIFKPPRV